MHTLKILIVEDNLLIALELKTCLQELGYNVCGVASSDKKAHELIKVQQPDLIMMDIELEKGSVDGIELTKQIKKDHDLPIIYLTSHFDKAAIRNRAFSTNPQNFLLKPVDINSAKLSIAIELAIRKHYSEDDDNIEDTLLVEDKNDSSFFIKQNRRMLKICFDDIVYLKGNGESVFIHTDTERILFMLRLGKTLEKLNRPNIIRIHKSHAINADKIHSYISTDKEKIVFFHHNNSKKELPFSEMYRATIANYHPRLTTK